MKKNENAWNLIMSMTEQQPKYYEFVKVFSDMIGNNLNKKQNSNCKVSIAVGEKKNQCFQEYLHTVFKNPVVIVGMYQNHPQIIVRSFDTYNGGQTIIALDMMEDIKIKTIQLSDHNAKHEIDFHYVPANIDYHIQVVVR